jgi:GTPase SAR1 family protein
MILAVKQHTFEIEQSPTNPALSGCYQTDTKGFQSQKRQLIGQPKFLKEQKPKSCTSTRDYHTFIQFVKMAELSDFDDQMKVIVVGNGRVGKTSLVRRFATGRYDEGYKQTIGVAFTEKEKFVESCQRAVTFMLWDTAG